MTPVQAAISPDTHNLLFMPAKAFETAMERCHPRIAERIAERLSSLRAEADRQVHLELERREIERMTEFLTGEINTLERTTQ